MEIERSLATLVEQGRWLSREIDELKSELRDVKQDVKGLLHFKWQTIGFASFAAFVATIIVEWVKR